jgi:hypothetical protein
VALATAYQVNRGEDDGCRRVFDRFHILGELHLALLVGAFGGLTVNSVPVAKKQKASRRLRNSIVSSPVCSRQREPRTVSSGPRETTPSRPSQRTVQAIGLRRNKVYLMGEFIARSYPAELRR